MNVNLIKWAFKKGNDECHCVVGRVRSLTRSAVKCNNSFISVTNTTLMCVLLLLSFLMKFIKCAIRELVVCTYIPGLMRLCHCLLMFIRLIFQSSFFLLPILTRGSVLFSILPCKAHNVLYELRSVAVIFMTLTREICNDMTQLKSKRSRFLFISLSFFHLFFLSSNLLDCLLMCFSLALTIALVHAL